jgi:hypothetical protein
MKLLPYFLVQPSSENYTQRKMYRTGRRLKHVRTGRRLKHVRTRRRLKHVRVGRRLSTSLRDDA